MAVTLLTSRLHAHLKLYVAPSRPAVLRTDFIFPSNPATLHILTAVSNRSLPTASGAMLSSALHTHMDV